MNDDHKLFLWIALQLIRIPVPDQGHFSHVTTIGWSPNGRYFAASGVYSGSLCWPYGTPVLSGTPLSPPGILGVGYNPCA
ncbi:hypothetical protein [Candidatus Flexifilum breve]|uniref:hypothetical protein n=1 Tax=Candidatus Flexifilum breve TaxID=3140694 RepID=UPI003313037A